MWLTDGGVSFLREVKLSTSHLKENSLFCLYTGEEKKDPLFFLLSLPPSPPSSPSSSSFTQLDKDYSCGLGSFVFIPCSNR